jgi:hypothetical protein
MSTIWTPGGEHEVPRSGPGGAGTGSGDGPEPAQQLSDEERARLEEAAREMAEVQAQLVSVPPEQIVANHLIGLYELAAIHLSRPEPNLAGSRLAIDAFGAVLDACRGRLGEAEATLVSARTQIQLAFVAASRPAAAGGPEEIAHPDAESGAPGSKSEGDGGAAGVGR